jgi:hypothetical protein
MFVPEDGMELVVLEDGLRKFGGMLVEPEAQEFEDSGWILYRCTGTDYTALTDRATVARAYEHMSLRDIVLDIVARDLSDEGIITTNVEQGPIIERAVFNYETVTQAFNELSELAIMAWHIDPYRSLNFRTRFALPTIEELSDDTIFKGSLLVRSDKSQYRNRQILRAGTGLTLPRTETFVGDSKRKTFNVAYPVGKEPAITVNGVAKTVGIREAEEGKDWYWNLGKTEVSQREQQGEAATVIRYHLPSAGTPPCTPAYGSMFDKTSSAARFPLVTTVTNTAQDARGSVSGATSPQTHLTAQHIGPPLSGSGTLTGTVKGQIRANTNNLSFNGTVGIAVRVVSNDGSIERGVLLNHTAPLPTTNPPEIPTTSTNRSFQSVDGTKLLPLTPVAYQDGDRLVVETGPRDEDTGTSRTGSLVYGDNHASDLPEDETTTTAMNAWVEFAFNSTIEMVTPLSPTDVLAVTYQGQFPIVIEAMLEGEIAERQVVEGGGSGRYTKVEDRPNIDTTEAASAALQALLARFGKVDRVLTCMTRVSEFEPGHLVPALFPSHGINEAIFVETVSGFLAPDGNQLHYTIQARTGEAVGGWQQYWRKITNIGRQYVIRENEVVIVVRSQTDNVRAADIIDLLTTAPEARIDHARIGFSIVA